MFSDNFFVNLLADLIIFGPFAAAAVWFTVALVRFLKTSADAPARKRRKTWLIASSVVLGVVIAVYVFFIVTLALALRNM